MHLMIRPLLVSLVLGGLLVSCSGDDEPGDAGTGDALAGDPCEDDTEAEPFTAGMTQTTSGGVTVTALSADPAPPGQGRNRWTLEVKDGGGEPVVGARVQVACTMFHPGGSHGCPATPGVVDQGDGKYEVYPITFNMPGHWEIAVGVPMGDKVEEATFPLCIQ